MERALGGGGQFAIDVEANAVAIGCNSDVGPSGGKRAAAPGAATRSAPHPSRRWCQNDELVEIERRTTSRPFSQQMAIDATIVPHPHLDGEHRWIAELEARVIRDPSPREPIELQGIVRGVSGRKEEHRDAQE